MMVGKFVKNWKSCATIIKVFLNNKDRRKRKSNGKRVKIGQKITKNVKFFLDKFKRGKIKVLINYSSKIN